MYFKDYQDNTKHNEMMDYAFSNEANFLSDEEEFDYLKNQYGENVENYAKQEKIKREIQRERTRKLFEEAKKRGSTNKSLVNINNNSQLIEAQEKE